MKLRILLATVALLSTLCSACSSDKRCVADAIADIAVSYAIAGKNDQALQVAQTMDNSALKAEALSEIAVKYVEAGQQDKAAELFTEAVQIANKIDFPSDKAVVLEEIGVNYGKARQKAKAAEVLSQALQVAQTIDGYSGKDTLAERIAVRYAEIGDYDQGIQVADTIWDDIPKGRALSQITLKYVKLGAYDQARQLADTIEAKVSKANALTEIAAKTGEYKQALWAAQNIEDESAELKTIILGKISLLYAKAGQQKQAVEVLSQALQAAKRIENTERKVDRLAKVALWYAQVGKKEQASEVFSQAVLVTRQIKDTASIAQAMAKVAGEYAKAGQREREEATSVFAQALQMAQTIQNDDSKVLTLAQLAIASAQIKPSNQVLEFTQTIGDANIQAYALTQIAEDYALAGQKEQAAKVLTQAFKIVQLSKNINNKAQSVAAIAVESAKIAQYDQAIAIAQTIDTTERNSPKASALAKIAYYSAIAGQKDKAVAVLPQALQAAKATKCSD